MSPEISGKVTQFCENAIGVKTAGVEIPKIPFVDDVLGAIVRGLTTAGIALDVVIEWVPVILTKIVTTAMSAKEIIEDVIRRIQGGDTPS